VPVEELVEATAAASGRTPAASWPRPPQSRSPWRLAWTALWTSRLVVLLSGVLGVLSFGTAPNARQFDEFGLTAPFGYFGNLLVSPLARWDSAWYLAIAQGGYDHSPERTTFFPLYPLLVRGLGTVLRSNLIAGVVISLGCFAVALVLLYRLTALELGDERARICVMLLAFCPMAYYFSAVYTESLFLALSVGCIYQARRGRWAWAGLLGALAAASRNTGVILVVPIVLLFLYGPRTDRSPPSLSTAAGLLARLRPRYPVGRELGWVLLVPVGLAAYILFLALTTGDAGSPFSAEKYWYHHFAGPFGGVWDGAVAAWDGVRQLLHGPPPPVYFKPAGGDPLMVAGQNVMLFGFLILGCVAFVGVLRRLPFAYAAYTLAAIAPALSSPITPQPLDSLPRYEIVLFPLFMWAARWVHIRRNEPQVIACLAVLLGLFTAEFATWRFVS
jgi:Mannosyltransferase (PIG-V)